MKTHKVILPNIFVGIKLAPYEILKTWVIAKCWQNISGDFVLSQESAVYEIVSCFIPLFRSKDTLHVALSILRLDEEYEGMQRVCDIYLGVLEEMNIEVQ
jgi:hypothetical protein